MRNIMKTSIYMTMAAMILTAALAVPAAAQKQVPFSGAIQGREFYVSQPPAALSVDGSGTGIATQLGQFTVAWKATVNLTDLLGIGSYHLIAANGDSIFTTLVGQGEPTDTPGVDRIVEINTITGGTGRFAGAKGSFTVERLVDLATGLTAGSFHGTITSPGSAK
jgi:hypothetical protein